MKKYLLVALMALANTTHADCLMRSSIKISQDQINSVPTDIQKMVVPDAKGNRCILHYRLHVGARWQTVEGVGLGATEPAACSNALDVSRGAILEEVTPKTVQADSQMVCSDLQEIHMHPVRIGDVIWESETDIHNIPAQRPYFRYKNTQCRLFVETNSKEMDLVIYQGVICRVDSTQQSRWQVVDKF
jgi:hypothetical protein